MPRPRTQQGALLLEFMVVAALSLVLMVWASQEWAQRARDLQARALAVWMEPARAAAEAFLQRHGAALRQADSPQALALQGYADWQAPSWAELRAHGLLPASWQEAGPLHQRLAVRILREGACPQSPCQLAALVHAHQPLQRSGGGVDQALIAEWLLASGGQGLVVWPQHPDRLTGAGRQLALPAGQAWSPGTVALLVGQLSGDEDASSNEPSADTEAFLRVQDPRDPDFQGDASVLGTVRSGAQLVAHDSLLLENAYPVHGVCSSEGAVARSQNPPGLLSCRQGRWQQVAGPAGGGYMLNTRRGCKNALGGSTANPLTGACSCATGYAMLQVAESGSLSAPEGLTTGFVCIPN